MPATLVDSHCHLDFPDLRGGDPRRRRPRPRRRRHPHGDDLHPPPPGAAGPRHRRGARRASSGPPAPTRCTPPRSPWRGSTSSPPSAAHPQVRRHRRDRPRLPLHRRQRRRPAGEPAPAHRGRPRHRPPPHRPRPRRRRRHGPHPRRGARRRPLRLRHALLHLRRRTGRDRPLPRLLPLDLRHRHLQERGSPARHLRRRPARPPPRRDRQPLPRARSRTAASATSPPTPPTPPASSPPTSASTRRNSPPSPPPTSTASSPRPRHDARKAFIPACSTWRAVVLPRTGGKTRRKKQSRAPARTVHGRNRAASRRPRPHAPCPAKMASRNSSHIPAAFQPRKIQPSNPSP